MTRRKIILNGYTYIIDYFFSNEDLINTPHEEKFYILKNQDIIESATIDKDIYFVNNKFFAENFNKNIIYPITYLDGFGYSASVKDFNKNLNEIKENSLNVYHIYDSSLNERSILCDKVRIYFPSVNPVIDALFDINNIVNDIKFHYIIDDISNYERKTETEFTEGNMNYSEYIEFYVPSINELLYSKDIYIKDYNVNMNDHTGKTISAENNEQSTEYIQFSTLYHPFKIIDKDDITVKSYIFKANYINNKLFSTFNFILYPYAEIDSEDKFIIDNEYSLISFNLDFSFKLISEIRFPYLDEIKDNDKFYGVPCIISKFKYPESDSMLLIDSYLKYNGTDIEDYYEYDIHSDNEIFELSEDDSNQIVKTGFLIEMSTDKKFKQKFFSYTININENENLIDNLIFPLNNIFSTWDDTPSFISVRITYIDKVSLTKIESNKVIISKEWYKYLVDGYFKPKLKLNNLCKENNMKIESPDILFIDKINCNIIKEDKSDNENKVYKSSSSPKVIYKPIFFRTSELNTVNIKRGLKQNIGINLGEYMSKVETFKLTIDDNEYIEYGRNDIFVIFNIDAKNITSTSGRYIILNEENEFISDGSWILS